MGLVIKDSMERSHLLNENGLWSSFDQTLPVKSYLQLWERAASGKFELILPSKSVYVSLNSSPQA